MKHSSVRMVALAGLLALGNAGCIKEMILNGTIEGTRKAAVAVDTVGDLEVARSAAFAGLAQFEGMHYLAPDNEDALFLLVQNWTGATFAFIEDQLEEAEDTQGDESDAYKYQAARSLAGYERALHYGVELLEHKHKGFEAAKKNDATMKAWLDRFDSRDDAGALFWTGYAWMARVNIAKEDPAMVSELFVGVAMVQRSMALDDTYYYGTAHTVMGAYHARTALAELDESKKELDLSIAKTNGNLLFPRVQLAQKYYCMKADKENYVKTLTAVVEAGDTLPEQRLSNAIAKRRAKRYLTKPRLAACGF